MEIDLLGPKLPAWRLAIIYYQNYVEWTRSKTFLTLYIFLPFFFVKSRYDELSPSSNSKNYTLFKSTFK